MTSILFEDIQPSGRASLSDCFDELAGMYATMDDELSAMGAKCAGCGVCCHFDVAEHVLYASRLERDYLRRTATPPDRPDAGPELLARGVRCPFQKGGQCLARQGRPMGCRTHFCAWTDIGQAEDFSIRWHERLKRLHERLGMAWEYAPLLPLE